MAYEIRFSKTARRDVRRLTPKLKMKLKTILLEVVALDPHSGKRLVGDLEGLYSMRLTFQDRIVYSIDEAHRIVYVHRARTHYEGKGVRSCILTFSGSADFQSDEH